MNALSHWGPCGRFALMTLHHIDSACCITPAARAIQSQDTVLSPFFTFNNIRLTIWSHFTLRYVIHLCGMRVTGRVHSSVHVQHAEVNTTLQLTVNEEYSLMTCVRELMQRPIMRERIGQKARKYWEFGRLKVVTLDFKLVKLFGPTLNMHTH